MALLAASAFAPAGDHDLSRSILEIVRHQYLAVWGEFNPSAAVIAINKATQAGRNSMPSLDWDRTTRASYGLFSSAPMRTYYHDKESSLNPPATRGSSFPRLPATLRET